MSFSYATSSRIFIGFVIAGALVAGCGFPVNERQSSPSRPEAKLGFDSSCLGEVGPSLSDWYKGNGQSSEISAAWDCLGSALEVFKSKVVGKDSLRDQYSPQELASFFQNYVLKDVRFDQQSLGEIMALKRLLIGGTEEKITRSEIEKLKSLMLLGREITLSMAPHMKIYTQEWSQGRDAGQSKTQFKLAGNAFDESVRKISATISSNQVEYDLRRIPRLVRELERISGSSGGFATSVDRYMPLLFKLKKALVGEPEATVAGNEWNLFGSSLSRSYMLYLRYQYFLKDRSDLFAEGADLSELEALALDFAGNLSESLKAKPSGALTSQDLWELLGTRILFGDVQVSKQLVDDVFALKRTLLGGNDQQLTAGESRLLENKIPALRRVLETFLQNKSFYLMSWAKASDIPLGQKSEVEGRKRLADAETKLLDLADEVNRLIELDYDLNRAISLIQEIQKLQSASNSEATDLAQYGPLLISAKNLLVADQGSILMKRHFGVVLKAAALGYSRYLEYHYFVSHFVSEGRLSELSKGIGLRSLTQLVDSGLTLAQMVPDQRMTGVVPSADFMPLWKSLKSSGLIGLTVSDETIQKLLPVLFDQILIDPELRLRGRSVGGLSRLALDYLRREFMSWSATQVLVSDVFTKALTAEQRSQEQMKTAWAQVRDCLAAQAQNPVLCSGVLPEGVLQSISAVQLARAADEMRRFFTSSFPVVHGRDQRLRLGDSAIPYTFESVSTLNLSRAIGRLIVQGYTASLPQVAGSTDYLLTREGANLAISHFNPLAAELGLIEANNTSFANLRFFEANLFTPHGDGSEETDIKEISTLVTYILSGLSHHRTIDDRIRNLYCAGQLERVGAEVSREDRVPVDCVIEAYRREMVNYNASEDTLPVALPQLVAYMKSIDGKSVNGQDALKTFISGLMIASGWGNDGSGYVRMKDISLVVHVMQYIESVIQRYDAPRGSVKDGVLNRAEAFAGFPIFRNVINFLLSKSDSASEVLRVGGDRLTKATYAFVLVHGGTPTCDPDNAELIKWTIIPTAWKKIEADRGKLGEILSVLASMTRGDQTATRCFYGTP